MGGDGSGDDGDWKTLPCESFHARVYTCVSGTAGPSACVLRVRARACGRRSCRSCVRVRPPGDSRRRRKRACESVRRDQSGIPWNKDRGSRQCRRVNGNPTATSPSASNTRTVEPPSWKIHIPPHRRHTHDDQPSAPARRKTRKTFSGIYYNDTVAFSCFCTTRGPIKLY